MPASYRWLLLLILRLLRAGASSFLTEPEIPEAGGGPDRAARVRRLMPAAGDTGKLLDRVVIGLRQETPAARSRSSRSGGLEYGGTPGGALSNQSPTWQASYT